MHLLYLSHELCDNVKARVRNDPQQSHQVFVLELPGQIGDTLSPRRQEENKHYQATQMHLIQKKMIRFHFYLSKMAAWLF